MTDSVLPENLIIVSGKGGVGKSSVAAATARLLARSENTVLVTLDLHDKPHPVFGVPLSYEPTEVAPRLSVCRIEALAAVREYVRRKMPFSGLYDSFLSSRMFRDFAEAAPGFRELMCLGKLYDLVTDSPYSRVVFDAPATGHLKTLLDVAKATLAAVHVGPLNHNARKIQDLLLDPSRTRVLLTAMPEEMALREAAELLDFCHQRRMTAGPVVVNRWVAQRFSEEEVTALQQLRGSAALTSAAEICVAESELAAVQADAIASLAAAQRLHVPRISDPLMVHEMMVETLDRELRAHAF